LQPFSRDFSGRQRLFVAGIAFAILSGAVVNPSDSPRFPGRGTSAAVASTVWSIGSITTKKRNNTMNAPTVRKSPFRPFESLRAKDLMSPNPVSIHRDATVREAVNLLTDRGFGATPVIDEAGHPVGVVSRTDILIHEREYVHHAYTREDVGWDVFPEPSWPEGFSIEVTDPTTVAEIMTPAIFTVSLETPVREVVKRMLELKVHHLFVVDADLALVGVISPLDVLRCLEE
jgi:CBS domain-containing protein